MAWTERESGKRRREEKWHTCWCCRDQQRACRMAQASTEKLEHTGLAEKERVVSVPQTEQLASTPEPPLPKGKRNRAVCPKHHIVRWERVKVSESGTLARDREGSEREYEEERVDSTVKEDKFQGGQGEQARRAFLGEVKGSTRE